MNLEQLARYLDRCAAGEMKLTREGMAAAADDIRASLCPTCGHALYLHTVSCRYGVPDEPCGCGGSGRVPDPETTP